MNHLLNSNISSHIDDSMATIRQYYDTEFDYCIRIKIKHKFRDILYEGAIFFDITAKSSFLSFYFSNQNYDYSFFVEFTKSLYKKSEFNIDSEIQLPAPSRMPGIVSIDNIRYTAINYQIFGAPKWKDLFSIRPSNRIIFFSESNLSLPEIEKFQIESEKNGFDVIFRSQNYIIDRKKFDFPHAFISHDHKDKNEIAKPIAIDLQRKSCPVWYDEFSLELGSNLRESIEKGLKECGKCILILSKNFFSNKGWGKKEFESIFTREIIEESELILPIWCGVTKQDVYDYSPSLLNVTGVNLKDAGLDEVCRRIYLAVSKKTSSRNSD